MIRLLIYRGKIPPDDKLLSPPTKWDNYPYFDYRECGLGPCNRHHLLFFQRHWDQGKASKKLRDLNYCKYYLPVATLHEDIHARMARGIPCPRPEDAACAKAYAAIDDWLDAGLIGPSDNLPKRLAVLARAFADYSPETAAALLRQQQIVVGFDRQLAIAV